jgi:hypothetical protein
VNKSSKAILRGTSLVLLIGACLIAAALIVGTPNNTRTASAAAGATLPYVEQQAENASTNGTLIDATQNRTYPGLAVEAIGRRAITLTGTGKFVEFTVPQTANSIVMRYSIPDGNNGAGIDSTISLYIGGVAQPDLPVTSRYGWIYGGYPFNNNPSDSRPHHYYDEVHRLVGTMNAGTKVRVQIDSDNTAPSYTIDLMDFEMVAPAGTQPAGSLI